MKTKEQVNNWLDAKGWSEIEDPDEFIRWMRGYGEDELDIKDEHGN